MAKKKSAAAKLRIYIIKVSLKSEPTIWRRIAIREDQTLGELHEAIFEAFDRIEEHLYSFYVPPVGVTGKKALRLAVEYTHPFCLEQPWDDREINDAEETELRALGLRQGRKIHYLFDFGDSWEHDVVFEKLNEPCESGVYPRIIERNGDSPPQYDFDDDDDDDDEDEDEDSED